MAFGCWLFIYIDGATERMVWVVSLVSLGTIRNRKQQVACQLPAQPPVLSTVICQAWVVSHWDVHVMYHVSATYIPCEYVLPRPISDNKITVWWILIPGNLWSLKYKCSLSALSPVHYNTDGFWFMRHNHHPGWQWLPSKFTQRAVFLRVWTSDHMHQNLWVLFKRAVFWVSFFGSKS